MRLAHVLPLAVIAAAASLAQAAAVTPGNVVIYRTGTGAAALSGSTAAVFLDEYTPTGTLVQSIPVSSSGAQSLTAIGNSTTEGAISPSQDGTKLVFGGYRLDAGTATGINVATTARVAATVDLSGTVDTSFSQTGLGTGAIRSATTVSGGNFYLGTSTGVFYAGTSGGTASVIDTRNSRQVALATYGTNANNLFASNGSTTIAAKVQSYGNLPTGTTAGVAAVTLDSADAVQGIAFLDLSPTVAGVDTLYLVKTTTGTTTGAPALFKFTFDGTNWTSNGSIATATGVDVAAVADGSGNVSVYLTTPTALQRVNDTSGYNGAFAGTLTTVATAGANTGFRGVGLLGGTFTAIPEPTSLAAVAGLGLLGVARRRKA